MRNEGSIGRAVTRYGRALVRHGRVLLPLGAAIGAGVGYLWEDVVFGLLVGIAFGAAWALLLALHTRGRHATHDAPDGADSTTSDASTDDA